MKVVLLDPTARDDLAFLAGFAPGIDPMAPDPPERSPDALLPGASAIVSRRVPVTGEVMDAAGGAPRNLTVPEAWLQPRRPCSCPHERLTPSSSWNPTPPPRSGNRRAPGRCLAGR